jgi:hypothetical protein
MVQPAHVEKSLQSTIISLREKLARREMAFGALFVGVRSDTNQPPGYLILMAEETPANIRIQMLSDLIECARKTIEHYRKAS